MPENLKNVLLFMASSGHLVPPAQTKDDPEKERMWNETWKRLDRFLPNLKQDTGFDEMEREANEANEPKGNFGEKEAGGEKGEMDEKKVSGEEQ